MGILATDGSRSFNSGCHLIQPADSVANFEVPGFSYPVTPGTTQSPLPPPAPHIIKSN